uniref:GldB n=1 Tax=Lentilactobacillus hilgardii TaxID=1588 RepID=Q6YNM5_LENHI|nr:GldB [Lentilactobacillus hilgardii]
MDKKNDALVEKVMAEMLKKGISVTPKNQPDSSGGIKLNDFTNSTCAVPELVGTRQIGDTIGMCIPSADALLLDKLHVSKRYSVLGILSSGSGAGPHIMAVDEAIKATNTEVIDIELPRDTKGGASHGSMILIGGYNGPEDDGPDDGGVSDGNLKPTSPTNGGSSKPTIPGSAAGTPNSASTKLTTSVAKTKQTITRAAGACHTAFDAPEGKAYGLICGAPAGIGVIMADTAIKTASVNVLSFASPSHGTSFSNEGMVHISGDSGAVRQAVIAGREVGLKLLGQMGDKPVNEFPSYIK